MLKLKAASFGVVRLQIENRILENNIKISCQPLLKKKKKKRSLWNSQILNSGVGVEVT